VSSGFEKIRKIWERLTGWSGSGGGGGGGCGGGSGRQIGRVVDRSQRRFDS
jgi:hypothetical protein